MNTSVFPLGLAAGVFFFVWGFLVRRANKRPSHLNDLLVLVISSYVTGTGLIFFLKGIDYAVNKWWGVGPFLGIASDDMLELVVIGSLLGILVLVASFWQYLKRGK